MNRIRERIRDVPNFPKPGIVFKDITPVLGDGETFARAVALLCEEIQTLGPLDAIVAIESRGFLFGAPCAAQLGVGLVPVRKPGKLPWQALREEYQLEYGSDSLEMHADALSSGQRAVILDDVLATGGTAEATIRLVERSGAKVAGAVFVITLGALGGKSRLSPTPVRSLLEYA